MRRTALFTNEPQICIIRTTLNSQYIESGDLNEPSDKLKKCYDIDTLGIAGLMSK